MSDKNKKILTPFELTTDERAWLARNGNMAHALRKLIREDMERKAATVVAKEEKDGPGR